MTLLNFVHFILTQRLFADYYNIFIRSTNPLRANRLLQETLDAITTWTSTNSFRFSSQTYFVIFEKRNPIPTLPPLSLQNFQSLSRNAAKILGLHFDQKLTWTHHIKILKAKCT